MRDQGSARDFDAWYRAEWPRLVATLSLAAGDRELGRELAAEALARALERWNRVAEMASPGGWAYTVGLNLLRRHHRRRRLEQRALPRYRSRQETAVFAEERVDLWKAIGSLSDRERSVVALRYGADMTEPEIAAVLGVAAGTISATLHHARAHLRDMLTEPVGEESHG